MFDDGHIFGDGDGSSGMVDTSQVGFDGGIS
jgi:hypothetical protein